MKKIISILLLAVMLLSTLALTVSAAPTVPDTLFTNADGNTLTPTFLNNSFNYDPNNGLYVDGTSANHSMVLFDQPLNENVLEAEFQATERQANTNNGQQIIGIVFAMTITDEDVADGQLINGRQYYLFLLSRIDHWCLLVRVGDGVGFTSNNYSADVPDNNIVAQVHPDDYDVNFTEGFKLKVEWDSDYNFRAYVDKQLVLETQDTATNKPDINGSMYGVYMSGTAKAQSDPTRNVTPYLTSFVAGVPSTPTEAGLDLSTSNISYRAGTTFDATVKVNGWDDTPGYTAGNAKGIEAVIDIPNTLRVDNITTALTGGTLFHNIGSDGKLRISYMDLDGQDGISNITVPEAGDSVNLFNITFALKENIPNTVVDRNLTITVDKLSIITSVSGPNSKKSIDVTGANGSVSVALQEVYNVSDLYGGDGSDLIPAGKKAVLVTVSGLPFDSAANAKKLTYNIGGIEFKYNQKLSTEMDCAAYVAFVATNVVINPTPENFTVADEDSKELIFGDIDASGELDAQDALAVVNFWLRKGDAPTEDQLLAANINGDSCIDTRDALGIVEVFLSSNSN